MNVLNVKPKITANEGRYLAFIYRKQNEESSRVRTTDMAKALGIQPASVTEMLQRLAGKGLLEYIRHREINLTEEELPKPENS